MSAPKAKTTDDANVGEQNVEELKGTKRAAEVSRKAKRSSLFT